MRDSLAMEIWIPAMNPYELRDRTFMPLKLAVVNGTLPAYPLRRNSSCGGIAALRAHVEQATVARMDLPICGRQSPRSCTCERQVSEL